MIARLRALFGGGAPPDASTGAALVSSGGGGSFTQWDTFVYAASPISSALDRGAVEFMLYMAYSLKAAPADLQARHYVQPALGRSWARTLWRGQYYGNAFNLDGALVWGVQSGALDGTDWNTKNQLHAFFSTNGLLLGSGDESADALFQCIG